MCVGILLKSRSPKSRIETNSVVHADAGVLMMVMTVTVTVTMTMMMMMMMMTMTMTVDDDDEGDDDDDDASDDDDDDAGQECRLFVVKSRHQFELVQHG